MSWATLGQQFVNALALGSVYAMIAVGLAMIYGVLRILHIAHAGVYTAGAYLGLYFFHLTGSFFVALAGSMLLTGLIGALIERVVYRPIIPKPRIVALIASIGIFICLSDLFRILAGPYQLAFDYPALAGEIRFLGMSAPSVDFAIIAGTAMTFGGLWLLVQKTRIGFGIRAVAQDIEAAKMMGIDVDRSIQAVFFLSSAVAAFGAIMVGVLYNAVYPSMGDMIGYKGLALIVIGGFGNMMGAVIAAFVLGFAETFVTTYSDVPLSREGIAMFMLVLLVMIRPQGLMGKRA
ncbi:branched-chain amino acid ABC transporter permease [Bradyrhizobium sp. NP1]|uniref:branched-chain amino acid ABC transporter permease n=1 Tax=Bradyrhizobium sp. NP1 TaxID=3049772 RepID=UPI0025A6524B|nr:branched-chain amino acid ABC transporter permease [Bradyrhizobium sp. NP1]WJR76842.1 branched-chain amino acid ABC transporter permease [Bradyrhizobium sp. NP1]